MAKLSEITQLSPDEILPLTCTRLGTCCHGKAVHLNPWELANMARARKISPREFRDRFCEYGGIRLRFDGKPGWKNLAACSQYEPGKGCSVHPGRPLVCRLYPLGRGKHGDAAVYMYEGEDFPCLEGCPGVKDLPSLSVSAYMEGQGADLFEKAQDLYLEMMQDIADGAFSLLLETGLSESGDRETLRSWRKMGAENPDDLERRLGDEWIDLLMLPGLDNNPGDPETFSRSHYDLIISRAEEIFAHCESPESLSEASSVMMGLALHLGRGLGADPSDLAEHWINTAKQHGALD